MISCFFMEISASWLTPIFEARPRRSGMLICVRSLMCRRLSFPESAGGRCWFSRAVGTVVGAGAGFEAASAA